MCISPSRGDLLAGRLRVKHGSIHTVAALPSLLPLPVGLAEGEKAISCHGPVWLIPSWPCCSTADYSSLPQSEKSSYSPQTWKISSYSYTAAAIREPEWSESKQWEVKIGSSRLKKRLLLLCYLQLASTFYDLSIIINIITNIMADWQYSYIKGRDPSSRYETTSVSCLHSKEVL